MYFKKFMTEEKYDKLCDISNQELLDRMRQFPDQNLLNNDMNGNPRKLQVGTVAEQYEGKPLDNDTWRNLRNAFSSITTLAAGTQDRPNMPDNVLGYDLWNFDYGGVDGQIISFGLTQEAPGKVAVNVPTTDLKTVKVGYLDEQFANTYPISDACIVAGQWHKGQIELIFDAEELYAESNLEPVLTNDGKHIYEMPFMIANIQYETQGWEGHDENPQILKVFEKNMNAFPVKDMVGDVLLQNGLDNPIVDVTWNMSGDGDHFKMRMISDKQLDGSQLLCADRALTYLTIESAYDENSDKHVFEKYMDIDAEFVKAVYDTFETRMRPSCDDIFCSEGHLTEVKAESDIALANDFANAVANISADNKGLEQ